MSAVYICFCVYAHDAGFVREVRKDSKRDLSKKIFGEC